jgi:multidrug resistance efflux pump
MEILLLGIYSFFVWLIFFKFKWLPWNITSQVIVVTIPIIALSVLMLCLNIFAPVTGDTRAINYVVQVVPRVTGRVIDVPVEPNRPVKKGDVLFKIDPTPFRLEVDRIEAQLAFSKTRLKQSKELSEVGAGSRFDVEKYETDIRQLEAQLNSAKWNLEQTVFYAPANGRVINLQLRVGSYAAQLPMVPSMTFVEDEQWIIALFNQNELHQVEPGNEAEISMKMYPGRIIKCTVDSIVWASGEGQLPLGGRIPDTGVMPTPPGRIAVKLKPTGRDADVFLSTGARGRCAIYTESGKMIHIVRKVILRVQAKLDWLVVKHVPSGHH